MRSTIAFGKLTFASIQSASSASRMRAKAVNTFRESVPLPWRLSHEFTVNGGRPRARRRASASTTYPKVVAGTAPGSASATTGG